MLRFQSLILVLTLATCGKPSSSTPNIPIPKMRLGAPVVLTGQVQAQNSTTVSRWYGKATHDEEAPTVLSDQRQAWVGSLPLRLSWDFAESLGGPRQLLTAVRTENSRWQEPWVASLFWQEPSGEVQILWQKVIPAQRDKVASQPWIDIEVSIPEGKGALMIGAQWEISGLAQQHGLQISCQQPEIRFSSPQRDFPDVVLISIDTLRFDALSKMPRLQSLIDEGWQWQQAYSPSNWTLPAMASLFTGLSVEEHGVGRGPFTKEPTGLAEYRTFHALTGLPTAANFFRSQGYATGMWFQNPFMESWSGMDSGFERYVHCADRPLSAAEDAFRWWQQQSGPRFLVLHEFTPHAPYSPDWMDIPDPLSTLPTAKWFGADLSPEDRQERFSLSPEEQKWVRKRYYHQLATLDDGLAQLVQKLRADSPDCLILIHADHGEELWDNGRFEHGFSFDSSVIHVPLALVWPSEIQPATAEDPVPAHHLLSLALELLSQRRGLSKSPLPQNHLRRAEGEEPIGGLVPLRISHPLYRSNLGGRTWDPTNGWQNLPFEGRGSEGFPAEIPSSTARQLIELGYTGEVHD